ncbi:hypothetical protein AJ85_19475 [Alkalihalobacillus alcalophilus ATCC 27647 = CGMCC 1.3604]|uniref:Uncharacterized protein n=1 Tax=Alkalihalobacillus alcalophilus ATCC 27647 = CGMCC 1.3604 TaxID=1218173 RepID=A0A4V6S0P5_ALKAL|nr:hypothetical protein [Alkalihalobacillus alcalophilus]MED1562003.1 hypothetical protein [Alkalihalobacillus alcalophilus]THG89152.1 hypothetical protein AJ85_19475 [Alkalihalobacillus alcalophilus ATCC 27647 = CGMCC 1.3604]
MEKILEQNREEKEWTLIIVTLISFLTFKKVNKVERMKEKLKAELNRK